tara:strand:- start:600 stop:743 length:144 start_codon:yes stop_codon:yes gene_type:complete
MKYFLCSMLFLLYACESINAPKKIKKNNKDQNIKMKVTTEPSIKIKK